jgi:spore germination cell wall hydrolase CwlJ-like protein
MTVFAKRFGAVALSAIFVAASFGAAGSGAVAQDQAQAESATLEPVDTITQDAAEGSDPAIRFVMSEVVQDLPETPTDEIAEPANAGSLRELVASIDTDVELSREVMCLAQAVYFEARGESLDGQLAVARVIINRAESGRFPDDYCSVVTQPSQFSFVRAGRIPTPNQASGAWDRAVAIARIAHRDLWDSAADDSLYFHARSLRPRWAGRMTARATIENHIFYR